jgi:hypothetical protein
MDEAEWLACADPQPMLAFLRGTASDRKLRLFAVACVRRVWRLVGRERSRWAVGIAELVADEKLGGDSLGRAYANAGTAPWPADTEAEHEAVVAARYTARAAAGTAARRAAAHVVRALRLSNGDTNDAEATATREVLGLLRCVFGNPFREPADEPSWLTPDIRLMARVAYDSRLREGQGGALRPFEVAALADALEEVGCPEAAILEHLRGPGPHVRGCHALDAVLGKGRWPPC